MRKYLKKYEYKLVKTVMPERDIQREVEELEMQKSLWDIKLNIFFEAL